MSNSNKPTGTTSDHKTESGADSQTDRDAAAPEDQDAESGRHFVTGLFEAIIPDLIKRAVSHGAVALAEEKIREKLVSEAVRRAINKGNEVVDSTEDHVRRVLAEVPLAGEVIDRITAKLDDYKGELFGMVSTEVREFLAGVDVGGELQKILTSVSFEVNTQVRFAPNEKSASSKSGKSSTVKPEIVTDVRLKRNSPSHRASGSDGGESTENPSESRS